MTPFTGSDFFVQSAVQLGAAGIRVRFSHSPLAASASGPNDALNPVQYTVTGPAANHVVAAAVVPDDSLSIDLALAAPLALGEYTLTVSSNVQTASGRPLQAPQFDSFTVEFLSPAGDINGGAKNDSAEATIRKHLPRSLSGRAWDALIAALAVGDRLNWDNARLAFDQLFESTASGLYLDRRASDQGIQRPADIGMPDDLFRQLVIKTSAAKITPEVLLEIMEVFYGSDSLRASATTELSQPFTIADGDTLELLMDERDAVLVTFKDEDFGNPVQAKAAEVAAAITRALRQNRNRGFAIGFTDTETGLQRVRIYSGSLGLSSSVRITGGRAQLGLNFPKKLTTYTGTVTGADAYNWVVTSPQPGVNRVSLTNGAGTSKVALGGVQAGDYVVFEAANSTIPEAVYEILDVAVSFSGAALVQYFEISGDIADHSFLQLGNAEMTFFRPERKSIHQAGTRVVAISQTALNRLDVQLPATTQAVGRTIGTGAYLHDTEALALSSIQRLGAVVTVQTSSNHGLTVGDQIQVEEVFGSTAGPSITAGVPSTSGNPGTSDYSLATTWTQMRAQDVQGTRRHAAVTLQDGRLLITGGFWNNGGPDTYILNCQHLRISATTTQPSGAKQYTYHWDAATSMATARAYHTGTLLLDGKVLVAGGSNAGYLSSCELYTPDGAAGAWAATGALAADRRYHAAVRLNDGRVLVMGGQNGGGILSSCEIWNPIGGTWSAAASMNLSRMQFTATVLSDGRVLVAGGLAAGPTFRGQCEIYDPGTNTWTPTGNMAFTRINHTATLLPDGRVLVTGGTGFQFAGDPAGATTLATTEIFNPALGTWAPAGTMAAGRTEHGALYISDRQAVLVAGGGVQKPEYFDVRTFRWRYTPNAPTHADALLSKSLSVIGALAVLHGGFRADGTTPPAFLYQPAEDVYELGGLNGVFRVETAPTAQSFTYRTPEYVGLTTNVSTSSRIKPLKAVDDEGVLGPFLFDPTGGVAVTATETEATQDVFANSQLTALEVADATIFPDEPGWLVIGFGTDTAVAPVKYLGRLSATALMLDYSYSFPATNLASGFSVASATRAANTTTLTLNLPSGTTDHGIVTGQRIYFKSISGSFSSGYKTITARTSTTISFADAGVNTTVANTGSVVVKGPKVTLLKDKGFYTPANPETVGSCYVTASAAGRIAALEALRSSVAAGIDTDVTIVYPGDAGLGGAGLPARGAQVLSDKVTVWGGDSLTEELDAAREDT